MNMMASAQNSYAMTGKNARVLGASPHQLITILLEELVNLLDEICIIHASGMQTDVADQQVMALSIVDSLILSLDMKGGGDLAINLKLIYSQVRGLISSNNPEQKLQNNRAAYEIIKEIYSAWSEIGAWNRGAKKAL